MANLTNQDQQLQLLINSLNATIDTNQQAQSFAEASLNQRLSSLLFHDVWFFGGYNL
ncbi:hypothetical protein Hanom_Chr04g00339451 [Helianthus anomalus]